MPTAARGRPKQVVTPQPAAQLGASVPGRRPGPAARGLVSTIVIITRDRPKSLARALSSATKHLAAHSRHPRVLVIDGSSERKNALRNRAAVGELAGASGHSISYVGQGDWRPFRTRLGRAGIPPRVLESTCSVGEIGASRNAALLLTAGENVLMVDDDVVWQPWALPNHRKTLCLAGHEDPRDLAFFSTREEAIAMARPVDVDLVGEHEELLSRDLLELVREDAAHSDVAKACGHMAAALSGDSPCKVRATCAGLAGDGARYCPEGTMFVPRTMTQLVETSLDEVRIGLRSREMHRCAAQRIVTHNPSCMTYFTAFDNRHLLPPFMPIGRGEDGLFGLMLASIDPNAMFGHLPVGIIHDSDRVSEYGSESFRAARETRLCEFIAWIVQVATPSGLTVSAPARLDGVAQTMIKLASMPFDKFTGLVKEVITKTRRAQLARVDAMLRSSVEFAAVWGGVFDSYTQVSGESERRDLFFLPVEFHAAYGCHEGFRAMQKFIGEFGQVVKWWPSMLQVAYQLKVEGRCLRTGMRVWR